MKPWYKSKALWFNIVAIGVAVAGEFGYSGELPDGWAIYVPVVVSVVNMILRLASGKPIAGKLAGALRRDG